MLDPLSALSVASTVVTFVDFVAELVREADAISSKGSSARVAQSKIVTADLISINASLRTRVPPRIVTDESLKAEEQVQLLPILRITLVAVNIARRVHTRYNAFTMARPALCSSEANKLYRRRSTTS